MSEFARYEDFGAIGDGLHDDMPAIVACHEYANEKGIEVYARDGAEYYIGGKNLTAIVKTSVHFGSAKFLIDDRELENIKAAIFCIESDEDFREVDIKSLSRDAAEVSFSHTGMTYVRVFNDNHKVYIRKGLNKNSGDSASDCFMVDGVGTILNDINRDYPTVTRAIAKSAEDKPITVDGGVFITTANKAPSKYTYHHRNIRIRRSNVTVKGLTHYIIGEGEHGAPYEGFISANECYNFTLDSCLLTPHFIYWTESQIPGKLVPMGTYGISLGAVIGVRLINIRQTIDINDRRYWGLMGSNFSKDVHLSGCVMSRFDAHCGVTNGSIKDSTLGHQGLNLIGFGKFTIENTSVAGGCFVSLRPDYGSFFDGEVVIRNCKWYARDVSQSIFGANNTGDHNFGYKCMMPKKITVDGLEVIFPEGAENSPLYVLPSYDAEYECGKPYAYVTPEEVILKGVTVSCAKDVLPYQNPEQYKDTEIKL